MKIFYVYKHLTADTNELFYIGKGKNRRAYEQNHNKFWRHIANKHGYIIEFIRENMTEKEALSLEKELIALHKPRANLSIGGRGGCTGIKRSKEDIEKRAETQRKQRSTPEWRRQQSIRSKEIANRPGMKEKIALGRRPWLEKVKNGEIPNPFKNKVVSEETKRKISESQKGEKGYWYGTNGPAAKPVINLTTGQVFKTILAAAKSLNGNDKSLSRRIKIGKPYKNNLFKLLEKSNLITEECLCPHISTVSVPVKI